jgi:hypothetical protein
MFIAAALSYHVCLDWRFSSLGFRYTVSKKGKNHYIDGLNAVRSVSSLADNLPPVCKQAWEDASGRIDVGLKYPVTEPLA